MCDVTTSEGLSAEVDYLTERVDDLTAAVTLAAAHLAQADPEDTGGCYECYEAAVIRLRVATERLSATASRLMVDVLFSRTGRPSQWTMPCWRLTSAGAE